MSDDWLITDTVYVSVSNSASVAKVQDAGRDCQHSVSARSSSMETDIRVSFLAATAK